MADSDLSVTFSGDTSQLNASLAQARQSLANFAPQSSSAASASLNILNAALGTAKRAADMLNPSVIANMTAAILTADAVKASASAYATYAETMTRAGYASAQFIRNTEVAPIKAEYDALTAAEGGLIAYAEAAGYAQRGTEMFQVANEGAVASIGRTIIAIREFPTSILQSIANGYNAIRISTFSSDARDTIGLIAQTGQLQAFTTAVDNAANAARAKMADVENAYQHALRTFAVRDDSGREVDQPKLDDVGDFSDLTAKRNADMAKAADGLKDVKQVLDGYIESLRQIPGMSDQAAEHVEAMLASVPGYTLAANDATIQYLQTFAKTGDEAVAMATKIAAAFKDTQNGAQTLADVVSSIKNPTGQLALAKDWGASMDPVQAQKFFAIIQAGMQHQIDALKTVDAQQQAVYNSSEAAQVFDKITGEFKQGAGYLSQQHSTNLQNIGDLEHQQLMLEVQLQHYKAITDQLADQKKIQDALNQSTASSRMNDLQEQNQTLQGGLATRKSGDDTDVSSAEKTLAIQTAVLEAANQTDEGVIAVLYSMKNRLNAGYGNYGDSLSGVIQKPYAYSGVDSAGGAFDPTKAASVSTDSYQYTRIASLFDKVFGDDTVDDPTGGATHYYNPSLAAPKWGSTMGNQTTIGQHVFGNPDGAPVMSSDDASKAGEIIAKNNDELRQQQALIDGGTAAEQNQLNILAQKANGSSDAVKNAQSALDVAKQQLAVTGQTVNEEGKVEADDDKPNAASATAQTKAAQDYYNAVNALRDADVAREKAAQDLKTAQTMEGSKARLDAELAGFDHDIAAAEGDATKILGIQKQKLEAIRQDNQQEASAAIATENAKFDAVQRTAKQEQDQIRENAQLGIISREQETAQIEASLAKETAATTAHFAAISAIQKQYNVQTQQDITSSALKSADALNKIDEQRLAQTRTINTQIAESYKATFDQIGSTVSSQLMQMIEGQSRFYKLIRAVLMNIIQQFIEARIKIVADWLAGQAQQTVATVTGQAAQTAAVTTGTAARTSAQAAGATAGLATQAAAALKSIGTSAAQTYGSVFAYLSPVMGPFAAVPAAGAAAAIMAEKALIGFETGAWQLPSSGIAMLHQNEMVVPAGPAQAFRDAMVGMGGGRSGGDTHHHTWNNTIDGSRDPRAVVAEIRNNAREIGRALSMNRS